MFEKYTFSKAMDELLQSFLTLPQGPRGCVCLCAQRHKTVYTGCFGFADAEKGTPVTPDTVFRIYSLTKLSTVTAAMILLERGKYLLDEPVSRYLPEYAHPVIFVPREGGYDTVPAQQPMLIRHALTMTCGLPYDVYDTEIASLMLSRERDLMAREGERYDLVSEVRAMGSVPLAFEPGTHWLYGYGHDIVGALVSVLSGMSLGEFMKKEIFDPLGMADTGFRFENPDQRRRLCTLYMPDASGAMVPAPARRDRFYEPEEKYEFAGGGLFSTPRDYLALTQALANGGVSADGYRLLGENTINLMRTNQLSGQPLEEFRHAGVHASYGYGLGVRVRMPGGGDSIAPPGEFGWSGYSGTWASVDPSSGFSCVYMHQLDPDLNEELHPRVRSVAYGTICNPRG